MLMWIISDSQPIGIQLRQLVTKWEHQCPAENLVRMERAGAALPNDRSADQLAMIVLAPHPDRGLAAIRQLRSRTTVPVIVVGPRDPSLILDAMRAGADDYVDDADSLEYELSAALQRQAAQHGGKSTPQGTLIAITGASGGSGRSLISVNLSILIAKALGKCCLMDLDPLGGVCASLLNVTGRHTILDLGQQPEKLDRNTLEQSLVAHESGVSLLPGAGELVPLSLFDGDFVERLVRGARTMFPAVLIDLHNLADEVLVKRLLSHDVKLVLVTRLDFNSICGTGRILEYWERCGISRKDVIVIANRRGQPGDVPFKKVEQALSLRIHHFLPDDPALANRSINSGVPVVCENPTSTLGKALSSLTGLLLGEEQMLRRSDASTTPQGKDGILSGLGLGTMFSRKT